jgi:hypothetical protein
LGFREFLISEQQLPTAPGQSIDKQLSTVRNRIKLKKKQILFKQLDCALKIIDDKIDIERLRDRLVTDPEIIKYMNGQNTEDNKKNLEIKNTNLN